MLNMTVSNETISLLIENEEEAIRRIPVIVYLGILLIVGVVGNFTVMVIYTRYFPSSNRRTFVLCLASLDLTACVLCVPFEIADMALPYMFYETIACKFFRFFQPFTAVGSALVLLVIAIERYIKVCHPLRRQMSHFQAKLFCGTAIGIAVFCSWPTSVFHGRKKIFLRNNITGIDCSRDDYYKNSTSKFVYDVALAVMCVIGMTSLMTLYTLMGKTIYRQEKFREKNAYFGRHLSNKRQLPRESVSIQEDSTNTMLSDGAPLESSDGKENKKPKRIIFSKKGYNSPSITLAEKNNAPPLNNSNIRKERLKSQSNKIKSSRKITKTMFIITLVFVLSYLPHLAILFVKLLTDGASHSKVLSSTVFPLISRSLFINNVANPIIYGFWDASFRQKCMWCFLRKKRAIAR